MPDEGPEFEASRPHPMSRRRSPDPRFPRGVPAARPVRINGQPDYAHADDSPATGSWPEPMSRARGLLEILLVIPAGVLGGYAASSMTDQVTFSDPRWAEVAMSFGIGLGAILGSAVLLIIARHGPSSIGLNVRAPAIDAVIGFVSLVMFYIVASLSLLAISAAFPELFSGQTAAQEAIQQTFPPMSAREAMIVMAFVVLWEETIFRGFLLTRMYAIFRRWWLTVILASVLFGAAHIYQGIVAVGMITILALIMGSLFAWRRSLIAPLVFHWVHNVFMLMLLRSISTNWD